VYSGLSAQITGDHLTDSLQSALSAASRGEAGLGSLNRSVRDASRALTSLRHAHESLTEELRVMYRGLNEVMSEKAAIERYAALLTQERDAALDAAEEARREAKREREFLLREQDRFIQLLLEEHEAEIQQLRRSIGLGVRTPGTSQSEPRASGTESAESELPDIELPPLPRIHVPEPARPVEERPRSGVAPLNRGRELEESAAARLASSARFQVPSARQPQNFPAESASAEPFREERSPGQSSGFSSAATARGTWDRVGSDTLRSEGQRSEAQRVEGQRVEGQRSEAQRSEGALGGEEERSPTYPPAPAVLDLDSLAAEVEGNSERPPPIRRIGSFEPKLHLRPARVPTQLFDTLISKTGGDEPKEG
jgi:hypothetical protein